MLRTILLFTFVAALSGTGYLRGEGESTPEFFYGGESNIASDDPDRATKAIAKWSDPAKWEGETLAAAAPYFWDYSIVGRPIFLRVVKNDNRKGILEAWLENPETRKFELFKMYRIAYFSGRLGPKEKEGDLQAPEGFYYIARAALNPHSSYHLSMDIAYPNEFDREHDRTGNLIMIHGSSVSIGCFAMTDASIEQLYTLVDAALSNGQSVVRVHCFPFPMTEENLEERAESDHIEFWENLKEGWDWFEEKRRPPNVAVKDGEYVFSEN